MTQKLHFEIDNISLINQLSDEQLALAEIWVCHDGNNLNNMPISLETLKRAAPTLLNKFLVAEFKNGDFTTHTPNEQIIGFFPKENNLRYQEKDGYVFLIADAIISKVYADWAVGVFSVENERPVSMEIEVIDTAKDALNRDEILDFAFMGVTILSKNTQEACVGSKANIVKFSTDEAEAFYRHFSNQYMDIDFTIPSAVKRNAKKGLELHSKFGGGTSVSLAMARHITGNSAISPEKARHAFNYLDSHKNKVTDKTTPNKEYVSWMLYGGNASYQWSKEITEQMDTIDSAPLTYFADTQDDTTTPEDDSNSEVYMEKDEFAQSKEDWGKGAAITVDKSKDAASDSAWGDVDKTALMHKVLSASNYKSLVHDVYLVVESGWEDAPSQKLKYPVMQISGDKAVYNLGGLSSALGYAKANGENAIVSKVEKIQSHLGAGENAKGKDGKEESKQKMAEQDYAQDTEAQETPQDMAAETPTEETQEDFAKGKDAEGTPDEEATETPAQEEQEQKDGKDDGDEGDNKTEMSNDPYLDVATALAFLRAETESEQAYLADAEQQALMSEMEKGQDCNMAFAAKALFARYQMLSAKLAEMTAKASEYESHAQNVDKENETLKTFKAEVENNQKQFTIDKTLKEVESYVPESVINELREETVTLALEDLDKWVNGVKARAFEFSKGKKDSGPTRYALPWNVSDKAKNTGSFWK